MKRIRPTVYCRRHFLKYAGLGAASLIVAPTDVIHAADAAAGREADAARTLSLSRTGGDRATAYVMSGKIARRHGLLLCTWLDVDRQNRWALVDPGKAAVLREGTVGPPRTDNHCGAAVATDCDGTLHLMIGAHHGSFVHYRMPVDGDDWQAVEGGRAIGQAATYPSLVCDRQGTLHLTYRHEPGGRNARLHYHRRPKDGSWSEPRVLAACAVSEHSWLTNAIEVGPEGRLHVVLSNTLPVPGAGPAARYYGASHLYSDDSSRSWRQFDEAETLALPAPGATLRRIEGDALDPQRIEAAYGGPAGPLHSYYHKILLSNVAVDERGCPWVVLHNLLEGTARLYRHEGSAGWRGIALDDAVGSVLPEYRIQHCGQLSPHRDGTIEALLMVAPEAERGWGAKGTELVRVLVGPDGSIRRSELVCAPDLNVPHWLPSLERFCWHAPVDRPAVLYTRGINAGGYSHNRNRVKTEVRLQLPSGQG